MRGVIAFTISALLLWIGSGWTADLSSCRYRALNVPDILTSPAQPSGDHQLAVFYAVPNDIGVNPAVLARIKQATADIQAWYQCAAGGVTWELAFPETVRVYNAQRERLYYLNNGNWWGSLLDEMRGAGLPIWTSGTICAVWAHGAGWWAGAAQFCGVDCGTALLGVELFPEFNAPAFSGGTCPGRTGVAAWPCTPVGAFAHELGHTLGLPHPIDVSATNAVAFHSIMQTHWDYPDFAAPDDRPWGFLTLERQTILSNPFMKRGIPLFQTHPACETVNLPSTGSAPIAGFTRDETQPNNIFAAINTSVDATWSYWTFGDLSASNATNAYHTYTVPGQYPVTLRAMASNAMISTASVNVTILLPARVFLSNGDRTIRLGSGRPAWCVRVELDSGHSLADVLLSSLVAKYAGGEAHAVAGNTQADGDKDRNGTDEIEACFSKGDLRSLFAGLPSGRNSITVGIEGDLVDGARFAGQVAVDVVAGSGPATVSISPNPFNPRAVLTFTTSLPGLSRVKLYSLNGRLVRTLVNETAAPAGYHDVIVDGLDNRGARLPSGIYFGKVETADGVSTVRMVMLK